MTVSEGEYTRNEDGFALDPIPDPDVASKRTEPTLEGDGASIFPVELVLGGEG